MSLHHSALFVQARLDSSRLPRKAVLPLGGMTVLDIVLRNLSGCADVHALLCPEDSQEVFLPLARRWGYQVLTGPKEDVLARFALAAERIQPKWIIRATADNTIVSCTLAKQLLEQCEKEQADYACFEKTPYGAGVEIISTAALKRAAKEATLAQGREHVCPYIIRHSKDFHIYKPLAPVQWQGPQLRATLDTAEDYEYLKKFHQQVQPKDFNILEEFIAWAKVV